ncbi:MAG: hypothetical protein ACYDD4_09645 [Acidimicrobiales bacterium]
MNSTEFGSLRHLVTRFFGALWPGGPRPADEAWARGWLVPGEQDLWARMSGPDRRHAVGVARGTLALLCAPDDFVTRADPGDVLRPVVAAALLHDVGKIESGLGTIPRAVLTMAAIVVGRRRLAAEPATAGREGRWRRRARQYLTHDQIGAEMLEAAGSDTLTVSWAGEHHRDPETWTVERDVAYALKEADGD